MRVSIVGQDTGGWDDHVAFNLEEFGESLPPLLTSSGSHGLSVGALSHVPGGRRLVRGVGPLSLLVDRAAVSSSLLAADVPTALSLRLKETTCLVVGPALASAMLTGASARSASCVPPRVLPYPAANRDDVSSCFLQTCGG